MLKNCGLFNTAILANSYFRFKQFTISQEHCAMKVCTDACLFGAWLAKRMLHQPVSKALDIGAGTGLLSLMLAQQHPNLEINAVELDTAAANQAAGNIQQSPWNDRVHVYPVGIQQYPVTNDYDLVFSNPPFFENDLKSASDTLNLALHSAALSLEELADIAIAQLKQEGHFAVLLPWHRTNYFRGLAASKGLFLVEETRVKQTPKHEFFRSMLFFSTTQGNTTAETEITIKEGAQYTPAFRELLDAYYLDVNRT